MIFIKRLALVTFLFVVTVTSVSAKNKINVFVSILPQQNFVQQVGGEYVDVHVMVGPGQNPTTYEPTPQQMAALANADIYFSIGVPFEKVWLDKIMQSNNNLEIVECCKSLSDIDGHSHDDENSLDPHIWTSPKKVILLVKLIEKALIKVNVENSAVFKSFADSFINKLNKLDESIDSQLSGLQQRNFIVSHPSWGYFSRDYNLTQISIEQNGKEIQARSMVRLIKLAKQKNIKAVFVQKQFNDKAALTIAKEIHAAVYEIDPLAFDYIDNMNDVTNKIVKGLSNE
ncbi:MAG: zinc ABC transporter solute-binding protein [Proteobacteria bacterium]|nr:ABC transporter substrate-binding protein [Pseudomonadota bacterium]NOG61071.1 zinc ABC transporter solute-binding protein [Pseudomonadota bacterium]